MCVCVCVSWRYRSNSCHPLKSSALPQLDRPVGHFLGLLFPYIRMERVLCTEMPSIISKSSAVYMSRTASTCTTIQIKYAWWQLRAQRVENGGEDGRTGIYSSEWMRDDVFIQCGCEKSSSYIIQHGLESREESKREQKLCVEYSREMRHDRRDGRGETLDILQTSARRINCSRVFLDWLLCILVLSLSSYRSFPLPFRLFQLSEKKRHTISLETVRYSFSLSWRTATGNDETREGVAFHLDRWRQHVAIDAGGSLVSNTRHPTYTVYI